MLTKCERVFSLHANFISKLYVIGHMHKVWYSRLKLCLYDYTKFLIYLATQYSAVFDFNSHQYVLTLYNINNPVDITHKLEQYNNKHTDATYASVYEIT